MAAQDDRRFDALTRLINIGMTRSRQALNTTELVQAAYGEDASVFGGTEMLVGALEDMLDNVHDQVVNQDLTKYLKEHKIEEMLDRFDHVLATLEAEEKWKSEQELQDQASAKQAVDTSVLPAGVTLENVVDFHKYRNALAKKDELAKALEQIHEEIAALEQEQTERTSALETQQQILHKNAQELNRSADICSMVGGGH